MTEQRVATTQPSNPMEEDNDEISLLDLLLVLAKNKGMILFASFVAGLLALVYALSLDNIYTSTTKILPPQQSQSSASAMLSQLGGLAGLAGGSLGKNPNDMYLAMMKSHRVLAAIAKRYELQTKYETKTFEEAVKALGAVVVITSGKDGIISVEIEDTDPQLAADMANAFVEELNNLLQQFALTEASQKRAFFEQQMRQAKDLLTNAEVRLDRTPNTSLQYLDALRNIKYHEAIWEILAKQFEAAKLDEAKDFPLIQVLDKALPSEKKSKPKRSLIVILAVLVAFFCAVIWAFIRESMLRARENPEQAERWQVLRDALKFR